MEQYRQINDKRIAKNTLMLYFRMIFTMVIGLYTSRVILDKLGESDFGIYNVVGGVVTMLSIISGTMATATQRYLSFEIGKATDGNVKSIFSTMVYIHLFLAFVVLVAGETLGVWFLNNCMNFPPDRMVATNWVFQFSLLTFIVSVINVPYNGAIIAYEKMSVFASLSIVDALFKLLICYLIALTPFDKLSVYAFLMMLIHVLLMIGYYIYCRMTFSECRVEGKVNVGYGKQVLSFVGWNLIGSLAWLAKEQGVNIVLNIFFGPVVNAARGIAYQVQSKINGFVTNFQMAMNPQIIKSYSAGERESMYKLVFRGAKLSYILLLTLSLPILFECPLILDLWLKKTPENTIVFLRLVLLIALLNALSNPLIIAMHASGKVRDYQIVVGSISLLTLPLVYVAFKFGMEPYMAMVISIAVELVCHIARLYMLSRVMDFPMISFLENVTIRVMLVTVLASLLPFVVYLLVQPVVLRFFAVCCISVASVLAVGYYVGLDKFERAFVIQKTIDLRNKILSKR